MIEVPRGALIAGQLAKTAEFFSFGTNDLTQMTFGISRDDAQVGRGGVMPGRVAPGADLSAAGVRIILSSSGLHSAAALPAPPCILPMHVG